MAGLLLRLQLPLDHTADVAEPCPLEAELVQLGADADPAIVRSRSLTAAAPARPAAGVRWMKSNSAIQRSAAARSQGPFFAGGLRRARRSISRETEVAYHRSPSLNVGTPLALNLAVEATMRGKSAAVLDLDPQQSAIAWHVARATRDPLRFSSYVMFAKEAAPDRRISSITGFSR